MSAGTRSSAMTATAPASSAMTACSAVVTSMITPPLSISARPLFTRIVPSSLMGAIVVTAPLSARPRLLRIDELLGEQRARDPAAGEIVVLEQRVDGSAHAGQIARLRPKLREPRPQRCSALRGIELRRHRPDGAAVELELAVRVTSRGEQQESASTHRGELSLVDVDGAGGEQRKPRRGVSRLALEPLQEPTSIHPVDFRESVLASAPLCLCDEPSGLHAHALRRCWPARSLDRRRLRHRLPRRAGADARRRRGPVTGGGADAPRAAGARALLSDRDLDDASAAGDASRRAPLAARRRYSRRNRGP